MVTKIDARYFEQRAVTELRMAFEAAHPKSAQAHRTLALMYLNLAASETAKRLPLVLSTRSAASRLSNFSA